MNIFNSGNVAIGNSTENSLYKFYIKTATNLATDFALNTENAAGNNLLRVKKIGRLTNWVSSK